MILEILHAILARDEIAGFLEYKLSEGRIVSVLYSQFLISSSCWFSKNKCWVFSLPLSVPDQELLFTIIKEKDTEPVSTFSEKNKTL